MVTACALVDRPQLLDQLRLQAAPLFVRAVRAALAAPSTEAPPALIELQQLAWAHYEALGERCMADAMDAIVPRADTLTVEAWSEQRLIVRGFDLLVKARAFRIAGYCVHLEVHSVDRAPLPFTETGYQSLFVSFAELATTTLEDYVRDLFPADPIQVGLF